ncbi:MAG: hypothetical protein AAF849_23035 [Bacteroidota bacterium]
MKKRNTRSTLLVLLVCASISSAVYLSLVSSETDNTQPPNVEMPVEEFDEKGNKSLPDVNLLKKVLGIGHKILSTTRQ